MTTLSRLATDAADALGLPVRRVRAVMDCLKTTGNLPKAARPGRRGDTHRATAPDAACVLVSIGATTAYGAPNVAASETVRRLQTEGFLLIAGYEHRPVTLSDGQVIAVPSPLAPGSPMLSIAATPLFVLRSVECALVDGQTGTNESTLERVIFTRTMGVGMAELRFLPIAAGAPAYSYFFAVASEFPRLEELAASVGGREKLLNTYLGVADSRTITRPAIEKIGQALGALTPDELAAYFPSGAPSPDFVTA